MAKNPFARKKRRKAVEKEKMAIEKPMTSSGERNEMGKFLSSTATKKSVKGKDKKPVIGCKMVLCEDPLTGDMRLFPVECPIRYTERLKSKMRKKGVRFSSEPFPEDVVLSTPEEEL